MATAVRNYLKIYRVNMPVDPPRAFLFSMCFKIIRPENIYAWKYVKIWCPLSEKISEYAADMKTFFKGLFTPFLGLTSFYLVNIQPDSKFYPPPHQNFFDPLLSKNWEFFRTPPLKYAGCAPGWG